jgi:S-adenosylmethionine:tRNA ribosyltransferase-isomerase
MRIENFDFDLPAQAIAQHPARPRDAARLLRVGERLEDRLVRDLPTILRPGDLLVLNDTKVIPTRLFGRRGCVALKATLIQELAPGRWRALARPARRLRPGDQIYFAPDFRAEVTSKNPDGTILLDFACGREKMAGALQAHGVAPLPPYIYRVVPDPRDGEDYQTVFAARPGAVAAPTAGLHFTSELLMALDAEGVRHTCITLHVGAGTFLPVRSKRIEDHIMHAERGEIGEDAAESIEACRARGGRVVAVGTTTLRLIETAATESRQVRAWSGQTALFIKPGFRFRATDLLLTNFHLPRSTLFMLVCAFAGTDRMKVAYTHALASGYRFYSYGDACLLERSEAE